MDGKSATFPEEREQRCQISDRLSLWRPTPDLTAAACDWKARSCRNQLDDATALACSHQPRGVKDVVHLPVSSCATRTIPRPTCHEQPSPASLHMSRRGYEAFPGVCPMTLPHQNMSWNFPGPRTLQASPSHSTARQTGPCQDDSKQRTRQWLRRQKGISSPRGGGSKICTRSVKSLLV